MLAGLGLVTLVIGVDLALAWRDTSPLYVLGGVLLGGLAGEALGIEARLQRLGDRLQRRVTRARPAGAPRSTVSEAFFTASLLFCVGPLTVVGSIEDGLRRRLRAAGDQGAARRLRGDRARGVARRRASRSPP